MEESKNMSDISTGYMLFSKEQNKYAPINKSKVSKGQFNTISSNWLKSQVIEFIKKSKKDSCLDPFAGSGDILNAIKSNLQLIVHGLDIDTKFGWELNDSLKSIPEKYSNSVIVTNPPYLAKYSASRKRLSNDIQNYYSNWNDLYLQALDVCLEQNEYVVAIVPETFLNTNYPKNHCQSITIILQNPFIDTDCPVCVVCMTKETRSLQEIDVFIEDKYISSFYDLCLNKIEPQGVLTVNFNDPNGSIGLRAVDLTGADDKIKFLPSDSLDYDRNNIKVSSRLITFISIEELPEKHIEPLIIEANQILSYWRKSTNDILMSPFKGNSKDGSRRRRLDYRTARGILEMAYLKINKQPIQSTLL